MLRSSTVQEWLEGLGYEFEEPPVPEEIADNIEWALAYRPKDLYHTSVSQQGTDQNDVALQIGIEVSDEHRSAIEELDEQDRVRFLHDLRLALIDRESFFTIEGEEKDGTAFPVQLVAGRRLLDDNITRSQFFDAQSELQSTGLMFVTMLRKVESLGEWG